MTKKQMFGIEFNKFSAMGGMRMIADVLAVYIGGSHALPFQERKVS